MKKLILLFTICIPLFSYSQRFEGGPLIGINASQIDGDRMGGYNKAGLVAGAYVYTDFRNKWGGQLEIRYAAKGSASSLRSVDKVKNRLQYIEMPILGTFDLSRKINLQAGGALGFLFSAQQNNGYGYEDIGPVDKYSFDLCIGASYLFLDNLSINARFAYSVLPIYAMYPGATGSFAWYNNVVTFAFYYRMGSRKY
jgi:hypothetical protein